jgi:hypothetical protein
MHGSTMSARSRTRPGDRIMPAPASSHAAFTAQRFTIKVDEDECLIRAAEVWPIADVLELESQLEPNGEQGTERIDAALAADLLDARMIPPPRPRRRRQRAVSSRAIFYATATD